MAQPLCRVIIDSGNQNAEKVMKREFLDEEETYD